MHKVLAKDIKKGMFVIYFGLPCEVIHIYKSVPDEIGLTLLQNGRTDPKMFHVTASLREQLQLSLKGVLKQL